MKSIDLVYFNAGGGHRSAAMALDTVIRELALPWRVRLVNLFEVLDPRDVFGKTTGMKPEQYYIGKGPSPTWWYRWCRISIAPCITRSSRCGRVRPM
jgi:hypothetical protein